MRIVILGTGAFAVPTFERLLLSPHDIAGVVTMPMRHSHGSKAVTTPVRSVAAAAGLEIFDPENINDPAFLPVLHNFQADLFFVCDYGKILGPHVLAATRLGGINLHGSLLPNYRGAAPINRALLNGEPAVGASVIHITPQLDAGPVVAMSEPLPVLPEDTAVEIEAKLAHIGAELVLSVLLQLESGTLEKIPQRDELATKAPKLKKQDGEIDWRRSAREIVRQYQALQPWPKIFTMWHRKNASESNPEPMRLILGRVRVADAEANTADVAPGTIVKVSEAGILVATGSVERERDHGDPSVLQILEIQPANKKMMPADAFLRGYPIMPGDCFSDRHFL